MAVKLARSMSGHDKGRFYVVIKEEDGYVYLADGVLKTLEKPKKKNLKHIQIIKKIPGPVEELLCRENPPGAVELKRALKLYEKSIETKKHFR